MCYKNISCNYSHDSDQNVRIFSCGRNKKVCCYIFECLGTAYQEESWCASKFKANKTTYNSVSHCFFAFLLISTSWTLHLDSLSSSRTSFCVSLRPSLWVTIFWVFVCLNFFHPHSGNIFVMGLDSKWAVSSSTSIVFPLFSFKWRCQSHFCPFGGDWSFLTLSLSLCLFPSMSPSLSSLSTTSKFIFVDCAGGGCTGLLEAVAQYLPLAAETYQHWFFTYCICLNIPHLPFWDSKYIHFVPFTQNFYSSYYP